MNKKIPPEIPSKTNLLKKTYGADNRISPKMNKPSPKIVFCYGKQDTQVREFLSFRKLVKNIIRELRTGMQTDETFTTRHTRGVCLQ